MLLRFFETEASIAVGSFGTADSVADVDVTCVLIDRRCVAETSSSTEGIGGSTGVGAVDAESS